MKPPGGIKYDQINEVFAGVIYRSFAYLLRLFPLEMEMLDIDRVCQNFQLFDCGRPVDVGRNH